MQIPQEIMDKWETLRSESDTKKIADLFKKMHEEDISIRTVQNAFSKGEASDELFEAMGEFYEEKLKLVGQYLPTHATQNITSPTDALAHPA